MVKFEEKQIAKEIVIEMIKANIVFRKEYPEAETVATMVCSAYKEILKTIVESGEI